VRILLDSCVWGGASQVIVRLVGLRAREQGAAVLQVVATYEEELRSGAILTVYRDRVRIRSDGRAGP